MTNYSRVLLDILGDYLALVGNDPDRKTRVRIARKTLEEDSIAAVLSDEDLHAEAARRRQAKRKTFAGASPVLRPCPYCGDEFGARAMREHTPQCPKRK